MKSFAHAGLLAVLCVACGEPGSPVSPSQPARGAAALSPGDAPSDSAATPSVPFKGSLEGTQRVTVVQAPIARVDGQATGTATHLGRFTVVFPHTVDFSTARGEGAYTFTAANGDTLTADFSGAARQGPIVSIVEIAVITGGTGRFAGAAGTFTVHRQFDPGTGVTTGSFEGTISSGSGGTRAVSE